MRSAGQDVRVNIEDLTIALAGLPLPRRKPVRYRPEAVAFIRMRREELEIEAGGVQARFPAKGAWFGVAAVDGWTLRRVVGRLPSGADVCLTGVDGRLAVGAGRLQVVLAAVTSPHEVWWRRTLARLYAMDVTTLPLFRPDLFRQRL
jgi:hypothetical protein